MDNDDLIQLTDENGEVFSFEFIDSVQYEGNIYFILSPAEDDSGLVQIFRVVGDDNDPDDETQLVTEDDESILDTVFELFMRQYNNAFDSED